MPAFNPEKEKMAISETLSTTESPNWRNELHRLNKGTLNFVNQTPIQSCSTIEESDSSKAATLEQQRPLVNNFLNQEQLKIKQDSNEELKKKEENFDNTAISCRICFSEDTEENMLAPCKCQGSSKFVHEICLRDWLVSKYQDFDEASCEVCQKKYSLKVNHFYKVCSPCRSPSSFIEFIIFLLSLSFLLLFGAILSYFAERFSSTKEASYFLTVLFGLLVMVTLGIITAHKLKKACVQKYVVLNRIMNAEQGLVPQTKSFVVISIN